MKRYELSVTFHSDRSEDDIVADLFKVLGTNAGIEMHEISDEEPGSIGADGLVVGGWRDF